MLMHFIRALQTCDSQIKYTHLKVAVYDGSYHLYAHLTKARTELSFETGNEMRQQHFSHIGHMQKWMHAQSMVQSWRTPGQRTREHMDVRTTLSAAIRD